MKVSFQSTKTEEFYTHHFIGVLANVGILRHFILKSIIWRLSSWKTIISQILLIRVLNHFLLSCIHLKLLFRIYLKEMRLLSCHSWKVLRFKFKKIFKNYLVINWRFVIWKLFLHHPLESKSFSPSNKICLKCYFQDLFTSISVVMAPMLPVMVRPNSKDHLKSEFVNI